MTTTANYNEALEQAYVLWDHREDSEDTPERLLMLGYQAALGDITSEFYKSIQAQNGRPESILVVFHDKLGAIASKIAPMRKKLKV
jgi:hypothetical protein